MYQLKMLKLISAAYVIVVIILSLVPESGAVSSGWADKIAHFTAYGGMGVLAYFLTGSLKKRFYLFIAIIALGVLMEFLQHYIPGRGASYLDIASNIAGALSGFAISHMYTISREPPSFGGCGSPRTTVPIKHEKEKKNN